jgi:hypothetical protein
MFDVALANWYGEPPGLCIHSETCGLALALEHTGDLYCCDLFVEPQYKLGNIRETHMLELVASERQRRFGLDKRDTLPRFCGTATSVRLPQGPLHPHPGRRVRPQLPVRRLQGVLPPRRPPHAAHVRAPSPRRSAFRHHRYTRQRTPRAAATTGAHAAQDASGSTATEARWICPWARLRRTPDHADRVMASPRQRLLKPRV